MLGAPRVVSVRPWPGPGEEEAWPSCTPSGQYRPPVSAPAAAPLGVGVVAASGSGGEEVLRPHVGGRSQPPGPAPAGGASRGSVLKRRGFRRGKHLGPDQSGTRSGGGGQALIGSANPPLSSETRGSCSVSCRTRLQTWCASALLVGASASVARASVAVGGNLVGDAHPYRLCAASWGRTSAPVAG